MEDMTMKSTKISLKKQFTIAYIALAALLVLLLAISTIIIVPKYSEYKKGQDLAISATMLVSDEFDNITDRKELIQAIYDELNWSMYYGGKYYSNRELDKALGELLSDSGYYCYYGSTYLEHTNYFSYYVSRYIIGIPLPVFGIIWGGLLVILAVLTLIYFMDRKTAIELNGDTITCRRVSGKSRQIMLRDIQSVEITGFHGLKIQGSGIKHRLSLIANNEEIKNAIVERLSAMNTPAPSAVSHVEELRQYKELLDMGAITQEEFDAKKRELLGL